MKEIANIALIILHFIFVALLIVAIFQTQDLFQKLVLTSFLFVIVKIEEIKDQQEKRS